MSSRLIQEVREHAGHICGIERTLLLEVAWRGYHEDDPEHKGGMPRQAGNQLLPPRHVFITERELMKQIGMERPAILDEPDAEAFHPTEYMRATKEWRANQRNKQNALDRLKDQYGLELRVPHANGLAAFKGRASVFRVPTVAELRESKDTYELYKRAKRDSRLEKQRAKPDSPKHETRFAP